MSSQKSELNTQLFADRLAHTRLLSGHTQKTLADAMGVSLRSVQGWESGDEGRPSPQHLRRLSDILRVQPNFLLGVEGVPGGAVAPGPAMPEWMAVLAERLAALDDAKRQRLLSAFHLVLDAAAAPTGFEGVSAPGPRPADGVDPRVMEVASKAGHLALRKVREASMKRPPVGPPTGQLKVTALQP